MKDKNIFWALLILVLASLACSGSILKPAANSRESSKPFPTEQALPSPIPDTPEIVSTETATATASTEFCTVTAAESLHMRDSPGISGIVINWLKQGDQLTLLPDPPEGDWIKVTTAKALTGWVNSTYCEMTQ